MLTSLFACVSLLATEKKYLFFTNLFESCLSNYSFILLGKNKDRSFSCVLALLMNVWQEEKASLDDY